MTLGGVTACVAWEEDIQHATTTNHRLLTHCIKVIFSSFSFRRIRLRGSADHMGNRLEVEEIPLIILSMCQ